MSKPKILFLYTELAEYFLACLEALEKQEIEIHVVRWPVNKEAPFQFRKLDRIQFYNRDEVTDEGLIELYHSIKPDITLTSGWVDKGYMGVCELAKKEAKSVLLFDNHWKGTMRQRLGTLMSSRVVGKRFNKCWIPGDAQREFANRLGFADKDISRGFYCADVDHFSSIFKPEREETPKVLLFVGRYLDFKGIFDLWSAFTELYAEGYSDWQLWCAGHGDLWDQRVEHPAITHHGFIQPADLSELINKAGVFVLPSHKEPWGVVIHEMAASGMPVVCSNSVGAAGRFVEDNVTGYLHNPADKGSLKVALKKMMSHSNDELRTMSAKSHELALSLTPEVWAQTLLQLL